MKSRLKWPFITVFISCVVVIGAGMLDRPTVKTFLAEVQQTGVR